MIGTITRTTILLVLLCLPINAFATLYDYSVNGQFEEDGTIYNVTGNMTISDEFIFHDGVDQHLPYYGFDIMQFSLNVNGSNTSFDFSGYNGVLYYSPAIFMLGKWSYMKAWGINNGQDSWSADPGGMIFYDSNMNPYEPTDVDNFGVLASNISIGGPLNVTQLPLPNEMIGGGPIWLTRYADPVPEPTTCIMLCTGLLGVVLLRKKVMI